MKEKKLTIKQEKFINKYLECGNASDAYRFAYDSSKMKEETVRSKACILLTKGNIRAIMEEKQDELKKKSTITKERILKELENILDSNIKDYVDFDGVNIRWKAFKDLTEKQLKAIESIKEGKYGIELKLQGKSWSIERICKMLGFDMPEKHDLTTDGKEIKIEVITSKDQIKKQE